MNTVKSLLRKSLCSGQGIRHCLARLGKLTVVKVWKILELVRECPYVGGGGGVRLIGNIQQATLARQPCRFAGIGYLHNAFCGR